MDRGYVRNETGNGRMQWGGFGFMAGIVLGVLIGWFFAGFIGAFVRVAMVALVFVPIVLLYIGWRKFVAPILRPPVQREYAEYVERGYAIETHIVAPGAEREPQVR